MKVEKKQTEEVRAFDEIRCLGCTSIEGVELQDETMTTEELGSENKPEFCNEYGVRNREQALQHQRERRWGGREMDIYKVVTETKRLEWDGDVFDNARVVWFADNCARQFPVSLDIVDGWSFLTSHGKIYTLSAIWSHFTRDEADAMVAWLGRTLQIPATIIPIPLPYRLDAEHAADWGEFIELDSLGSYPFDFPIAGAIVRWSEVHSAFPINDTINGKDDINETWLLEEFVDDEVSSLTSQSPDNRELCKALDKADHYLLLSEMLLLARGQSVEDSVRRARVIVADTRSKEFE